MVEELTEKLNKAISRKTVKVRKWRMGTKKWWDKECTELKRITRRALKKWRKGEDSKDNYEKKKKNIRINAKRRKQDGKKRKNKKYSKSPMKIKHGNILTEGGKKNRNYKEDRDGQMEGLFYAIIRWNGNTRTHQRRDKRGRRRE